MSRKVLVTGATGFLGANLVRLLVQRGEEVRALVRPTSDRSGLEGLPIEVAQGDVRDVSSVRRAVAGCQRVFHLAAHHRFWAVHPKEFYETNVRGTAFVMDACLAEGVERVVFTSSACTIGSAGSPALSSEATPLRPGELASAYERTKLHAEQAALSYVQLGLPVVVVNPSTAIGPWDLKPTPAGKMLVEFASGRVPVLVDAGLNLVHVRDVAEGHWLAAERGRVGERYLLGGQNTTLAEVLAELANVAGRPAPWLRVPYLAAWAAGVASTALATWVTRRPPAVPLEAVQLLRRRRFLDSSKAIRELGLPQTPLRAALEEAVSWFQERGYVPVPQKRMAWASR